MNENKEIEEMAKDMGIAFQLAGTTRFGTVAEILVEAGYRNCKDKVVLSKEEYESIQKLLTYDKPMLGRIDSFIKDIKEQARKEEQEKFVKTCENCRYIKYYDLYKKELNKDKVVLDKEEYQNDFSSQFNKGYSHGRQEAAREILKAIKNHRNKIEEKLKDSFWEVSGTDLMEESLCGVIDEYGFFDILDDIAKEYGVEVE